MNSKIKYIRETLNLTEKDVSTFLNISSYKYVMYEKTGIEVPCEIILLLSKLYKISPEMLIEHNVPNDDILLQLHRNNLTNIPKEQILLLLKQNLFNCSETNLSYRSVNKVKKDFQNNIIKFILSTMETNNLSQLDFSSIIDVSPSDLNSVISKKRFISLEELIKTSQKFNISLMEIIG